MDDKKFSEDDDFDFSSFDDEADGLITFGEYDDETRKLPTARARILEGKFRAKRVQRTDAIKELIRDLPKPGEIIHVVGGGLWNFWDMVPAFIELRGPIAELYAATWTASFQTARDLEEFLRKGQIKTAFFLFGTYFKRREPVAYTKFAEAVLKYGRGGKIRTLETHMKVLIMRGEKGDNVIAEGSANLNNNPRLEQCTLTNSEDIFKFYKEIFEDIYALEGNKFLWG